MTEEYKAKVERVRRAGGDELVEFFLRSRGNDSNPVRQARKRKASSEAFDSGCEAFRAGKHLTDCPFPKGKLREKWKDGWVLWCRLSRSRP